MGMPIAPLYFIDMPRAINKGKLVEFYAGIEDIKNGHCWDCRYRFSELYFDSPSIWLFSNTIPDFKLLSPDRWMIWTIDNNELFLYNNGNGLLKGPEIIYPEPEVEEIEEVDSDDDCSIDSQSEVDMAEFEKTLDNEVIIGSDEVIHMMNDTINEINEINIPHTDV